MARSGLADFNIWWNWKFGCGQPIRQIGCDLSRYGADLSIQASCFPESQPELEKLVRCGLSLTVHRRYSLPLRAHRICAFVSYLVIRVARRIRSADLSGHVSIGSGIVMAKTNRKLNKANHGRRPASAKARRLKRRHVRLSR